MNAGSWHQRVAELAAADATLAAVVAEHGVPDRWTRPPGFPALVLLILEQQVSLASGAAAYRRVAERAGGMTPERLLAVPPADLRVAGVSRQKDRYLRALAEAVTTGTLDLAALQEVGDDEVRTALTRLPGVGTWTADAYLLACLDRPDVWPVGDRALQVAVSETLALRAVPTQQELLRLGERWRPNRSDAARLLWHGYLSRRGRAETVVDLSPAPPAPTDPRGG